MKKLIFPAILLIATVLGPVRAGAEEKETPLGKEMEKLNDIYKSFRKETDGAKGAASAREAQAAILKSIPLTPAMLEKMPAGEEKEKALTKYKMQMGKLYVSLCEVEAAYLAKDMPAVAKLVETLKGQKKEGHDAFVEEEE